MTSRTSRAAVAIGRAPSPIRRRVAFVCAYLRMQGAALCALLATATLSLGACREGASEPVADLADGEPAPPDVHLDISPLPDTAVTPDATSSGDSDVAVAFDIPTAADGDADIAGDAEVTCAPSKGAVDGRLKAEKLDSADPRDACPEYPDNQVIGGQYGTFRIKATQVGSGLRLQLHNDWRLRKLVDICPAMYNLFQFTTGGGSQAWELRVYGDPKGAIDVRLNGVPYSGPATGHYVFEPSVDETTPHTQFEFSIDGVEIGEVGLIGHDPIAASPSDTSTPGCDKPHEANVTEPTLLIATLQADGGAKVSTGKGVVLAWVAPPAVVPGQAIRLYGKDFGSAGHVYAVDASGTKMNWPTTAWLDTVIDLVPPKQPLGTQVGLIVWPLGSSKSSNELKLTFKAQGPPESCATAPPLAPCDDGDAATYGDVCTNASTCVGLPTACTSATACEISVFDTTLLACVAKAAPGTDGKPCDDGNICTTGDVCVAGLCAGAPAVCEDGNICTTDYCGAVKGCSAMNTAGTCEADGSACSLDDACADGVCKAGKLLSCDDNNPCTTDSCDTAKGCLYADADGTLCNADDNPCTVDDGCVAGACKPGKPIICPAGGCPEACDISTGTCKPTGASVPCDDGSVCTLGDTCSAKGSCGGAPISCDDGLPCTVDACDALKGCTHTKSTAPDCF